MWCTSHATHGVVLTIFRVTYVHFETDLHLLGLLILLQLLDHRNLSLHAPGDLGNLIDDLHMRNPFRFSAVRMFNTSSSALSDRRSVCLVTEPVPSAQLGRQLFCQ